MVDPVAFRHFKPNSQIIRYVHHKLDPEALSEQEYLICSPILLGFCFGTKLWGKCRVGLSTL